MMTKTLHWCARRISDLGEALFDLGGSLELWCDERAERKRWVAPACRAETARREAFAG